MGLFSKFENKAQDVIEGTSGKSRAGIDPVKLAKRAYKEMQREKMVGVSAEYAPTLYNILVSAEDDRLMSGNYPSIAGEIETYLTGRAEEAGLVFDCPPLVRFIVDDGLKRARFDIIAESVSELIIEDLRTEEMEHYGLLKKHETNETKTANDNFPDTDEGQGSYRQPKSFPPERHQQKYEQSIEKACSPYDSERLRRKKSPDEFQSESFQHELHEQSADELAHTFEPTGADEAPSGTERTLLIDTVEKSPHALLVDLRSGKSHPLIDSRIIIGRGSTCNIILSDASVSRHHAELLNDGNGWLIRDTGSTNGTSVNGAKATQSRLYNGDRIILGTAELEFREE